MHRTFVALLLIAGAASGRAQGTVYPDRKHFIVIGEALATGTGGSVFGGTTIMHAMRVSAVATIRGNQGIDFTATRLQTVFPPSGRVNDLEFANPEGDAYVVSWAQFSRSRARGFPNELALGGGFIRRNTSEAGRTRDTWVARVGYDSDAFYRVSHADAGVSFHAFFMPANANNLVYVATLGLMFRIG
jgi:hypothetical protein